MTPAAAAKLAALFNAASRPAREIAAKLRLFGQEVAARHIEAAALEYEAAADVLAGRAPGIVQ
jgi:hypothetical protein